jgi:transcriptional regulator with XRE-family HTH domain
MDFALAILEHMPRKARSLRSPEEKTSDATLGKRLATLRKERGFTLVELADKVGVIQPIISDYERGRLRPHPDMLVRLAGALSISSDELLGIATTPKASPTINRRFLRRLQAVDNLPKRDQEALLRTIDAFLSKSA